MQFPAGPSCGWDANLVPFPRTLFFFFLFPFSDTSGDSSQGLISRVSGRRRRNDSGPKWVSKRTLGFLGPSQNLTPSGLWSLPSSLFLNPNTFSILTAVVLIVPTLWHYNFFISYYIIFWGVGFVAKSQFCHLLRSARPKISCCQKKIGTSSNRMTEWRPAGELLGACAPEAESGRACAAMFLGG